MKRQSRMPPLATEGVARTLSLQNLRERVLRKAVAQRQQTFFERCRINIGRERAWACHGKLGRNQGDRR